MKTDIVKIYLANFALFLILSFALFVSNKFERLIIAGILIIYTIIVITSLKKRNVLSANKKQIVILFTALACIYLLFFYLLGWYVGFYKSSIRLSFWSLINYILPIATIIITTEIIRNIFIANETKKSKILTFVNMIFVDVLIYKNILDVSSLERTLTLVGFVIFASISSNLLYNFISKKYGPEAIIIYKLITVLYVYFIPVIPDVYIFFRAVIRMLYPYIIYKIIEYIYIQNTDTIAYKDRNKNIIYEAIFISIIISIVMLISCKFTYGIIVIGSGSMTGTINKGDAIIFRKYNGKEQEIGQVVLFEKNDIKVVHRIVDVKNINNENRYFTRGDANNKNDNGYITDKEIIGNSIFKIPFIGYPTIWIRDILSN